VRRFSQIIKTNLPQDATRVATSGRSLLELQEYQTSALKEYFD